MTPLPGAPNPLVGTWKLVSFQFEFSQLIGVYWRW